jgi:hypothetical protein
MSDSKDNKGTNTLIAIIIGIGVIYFIFKYLGIWLGYGLLAIGILHIPYNYFIKNFTKQTLINSSIFIGLALFSFSLNYFMNYSDCECNNIMRGELSHSIFGKGEVDRRGYDECLEKWHNEAIEADYKSNNKGVYIDPVQYFDERCDDNK